LIGFLERGVSQKNLAPDKTTALSWFGASGDGLDLNGKGPPACLKPMTLDDECPAVSKVHLVVKLKWVYRDSHFS